MGREELLRECLLEERAALERWDARHLEATGRMVASDMPWSYTDKATRRLKDSKALAVMAVRGGERLADMAPLPFHVHATEADPALVDTARLRLSALGVKVHPVERESDLPLQENYFDLVLNRHRQYIVNEVRRVTRDDGVFLTEQIGGDDGIELNQHLELRRPAALLAWNLSCAVAALREGGFDIIDAREVTLERRFFDTSAIVYFVKHLPAYYPGFSVSRRERALLTLDRYLQTRGSVYARKTRFLIVARRR
jgi:SAM-dependent methyltransferase